MRRILEDYGVLRYFDMTVFSDEIGLCKPHEVMFRTALEYLNVEPWEALHVGDLINHDVFGAKRIGMRTAWFKTGSEEHPADVVPDFIITRLPDLVKIVERLLG
jgi:putative hydrolase of the HAD superfamily